jgi:hypothetical protein
LLQTIKENEAVNLVDASAAITDHRQHLMLQKFDPFCCVKSAIRMVD